MENLEKNKENKNKNLKIKKEINRLVEVLKNKGIDIDKLKIAEDLIKDIAFMTIESAELKEQVQIYGTTEEYQNGANQRGRKKSACFEAYLNLTKQKAVLIKQLTELLPEDEGMPQKIDDDSEEFFRFRECKNERKSDYSIQQEDTKR